MSDDLVKRARDDAFLSRATKAAHEIRRAELTEALADELDRLQAENERLRAALEKIAGPGKSYLNDAGNFRRCQDEARAALKANGGKE